ncbi:hypothetical protein [Pseudomonas japonica]|uniref:Uncharacterized protein n=1 Tax=Pseudomonas japonica TaxID=256466 RepID=A0A239DR53_9PSED|nr:hypothetical protein [Pseudomonas japonica]SNS34817.1 hypothetical protein SAMN05444352_106217 [Pseudomonas japonica]
MKKLVPDPPVLCVGPGLHHEEAVRKAEEHLKRAIHAASSLPDLPTERHQMMLSNALLNMRISKALLSVALSASSVAVPV